MARGRIPTASGHCPATGCPPVAGRVAAWPTLLVAAALVAAAPAHGQDGSTVRPVTVTPPARIGGSAPPCQANLADGKTATAADCAAARLDQAAKLAGDSAAPSDPTLSAPGVTTSPNRVGVTTPAAVSQQMGPNLGKSVIPYRPPPPIYAPPPFAKR